MISCIRLHLWKFRCFSGVFFGVVIAFLSIQETDIILEIQIINKLDRNVAVYADMIKMIKK